MKCLTYDRIEVEAVDTDEPLIGVYYNGPFQFAKVTVASGGDITCKADNTDGATTTALAGVAIDVSTTPYDTWGEVVDFINTYNSTGWHAYPIGARRSDSSNDTAATLAATTCKSKAVNLLHDTSIALTGEGYYAVTFGLTTENIGINNSGKIIYLGELSFNVAYASGSATIHVYDCDDTAGTDNEIYSVVAGDNTVALAKGLNDWNDISKTSAKHGRFVVRVVNDSVEMTSPVCHCLWASEHTEPSTNAGGYISEV